MHLQKGSIHVSLRHPRRLTRSGVFTAGEFSVAQTTIISKQSDDAQNEFDVFEILR